MAQRKPPGTNPLLWVPPFPLFRLSLRVCTLVLHLGILFCKILWNHTYLHRSHLYESMLPGYVDNLTPLCSLISQMWTTEASCRFHFPWQPIWGICTTEGPADSPRSSTRSCQWFSAVASVAPKLTHFKRVYLSLCMWVFVYMYVCMCTIGYACPWASEEGVGSPRTGVINSCEQPYECWERNPGPLWGQHVLLTEMSRQPRLPDF